MPIVLLVSATSTGNEANQYNQDETPEMAQREENIEIKTWFAHGKSCLLRLGLLVTLRVAYHTNRLLYHFPIFAVH